jgi:hypothetical protein
VIGGVGGREGKVVISLMTAEAVVLRPAFNATGMS